MKPDRSDTLSFDHAVQRGSVTVAQFDRCCGPPPAEGDFWSDADATPVAPPKEKAKGEKRRRK